MAAVQERSLGCARDDEAGERIGSQGRRAVFLEEGILVSQPSPLGEGAPQGRIGHRRYERQMRKAEKCAAHVGERENLTAKDND